MTSRSRARSQPRTFTSLLGPTATARKLASTCVRRESRLPFTSRTGCSRLARPPTFSTCSEELTNPAAARTGSRRGLRLSSRSNTATLARLDDERNSQPMLERLFEWRALAEAGRFADLFDALLHQSGLVERELLLSDGRRELTNYEHIFEILTQHASRHGISLAEIIELLDAYISGRATPAGDDPDVQRLEDDRDAVQIMTIHKSKGLEADVVALYGGFFANNRPDPVSIYHHGNERRLAIGKPARDIEEARDQERAGRGGSAIALRRADPRARQADTALRPGWNAESRPVGLLCATERSAARPRSRSSIGDALHDGNCGRSSVDRFTKRKRGLRN